MLCLLRLEQQRAIGLYRSRPLALREFDVQKSAIDQCNHSLSLARFHQRTVMLDRSSKCPGERPKLPGAPSNQPAKGVPERSPFRSRIAVRETNQGVGEVSR